ncbi:hypothetical protein CCACVL1_09562 [Corchorus capsularis]|uniref:Uncharacterized protein n=1 Tax=Corchorus capsularis TaxID=210143 RepID=A0A1R3IVE2_COCAP|nr:hypothetical protein CCACVL1_09562 [Corchorus capsularis]
MDKMLVRVDSSGSETITYGKARLKTRRIGLQGGKLVKPNKQFKGSKV